MSEYIIRKLFPREKIKNILAFYYRLEHFIKI